MQTDPGSPVKTGYVKVLDNKGNIKSLFRYEELYLNMRKRQEAAYLAAVNRGKICCCCMRTKTVNINIESNGTVTFPDFTMHSPECVRFLNEITTYIDATPIKASLEDLPIQVRFNWEKPAPVIMKAQIRDLEMARRRELSFSQWLIINNAIAFSGNEDLWISPERMCDIFTDRISGQTIEYSSKSTDITVRTGEDFLFRDGMDEGSTGFYYGKILDVPAKYNSGKGKNMYIIVSRMQSRGNLRNRRDIFLRVPKDKFMIPYERVPDKKHVYIGGFIRTRDVFLDAAEVKFPSSISVNPTKVGSFGDNPEKNRKRIYEMRTGCLFTALDNGLAVFSKEEFESGQKAVSERKVCYRKISEDWGDEFSLKAVNINGEDEKLG